MARAFIIMLDSFGVGSLPDAHRYHDEGSDTLRHIAEYCEQGKANQPGVRSGPLHLPHLTRLGLNQIAMLAKGKSLPGFDPTPSPEGAYGCAASKSLGKDTQSGHWEMAGVPVLFEWGYFPPDYPSFPVQLLERLIQQANLPGVLGNKHASGTAIIEEFGEAHQQTGKPIVYTSADSVFQIAAHEESFGLARLYEVCQIIRKLVDEYNIGRVIARPFLGTPGHYYRTGNRRDYAVPPPQPTLLDQLVRAGGTVIAIGKVADIYAHHGISKVVKANGNSALFATFINEAKTAPEQSITFVNLVDFDMLYGHRRNVTGYAKALEDFDHALPQLEAILQKDDVVVITADHGCDPTWSGSDHTREYVPVLIFGPGIKPGSLGIRESFADIGQSLAHHLRLPALDHGKSFL